jgi:hypothetical protein
LPFVTQFRDSRAGFLDEPCIAWQEAECRRASLAGPLEMAQLTQLQKKEVRAGPTAEDP